MNKALLIILAVAAAARPARAGSYMQQASIPLSLASVQAIDRDAAGNLYVLGQPSGSGSYSVAVYQTQGLEPLLSFDAAATDPVIFRVEGTGNSDLLDLDPYSGAFSLKRFSNAGTLLGQTSIPYTIERYYSYAAALDAVNQRVYLAKFWTIKPCLDLLGGCSGPPAGTRGYVYQYDFQGVLLRTITLPGDTSSNGSCYEPRNLTVDPLGNLFVGDSYCKHLLRYSADGALLSDSPIATDFYPTSIWTDSASNVYSSQSVCAGTGTSNCRPGIVKFSPEGSVLTSVVTDPSQGSGFPTAYNSGAAWDSRIIYLSSFGAPPLRRFVYDDLPAVPTQASPISAVVQHSSAADLTWRQSNDPNGDMVSYAVYLGTSATGLQLAGETGDTSLASVPLSFGATYFWQVVAKDSYLGLPVADTPSPIGSFNLNLTNEPPAAFGPRSGAGAAVTRATSVNLSWDSALDPEGDAVSYTLSWRPTGQSTPTIIVTTATSQPMTGLSFGTTYFWSVVAQDSYGATRPMASGTTQAYTPVFLNNPPPAPIVTGGIGISEQHTLTPRLRLSWSSVSDPEGDGVSYKLSLGTSASGLTPVQDGAGTDYDFSPLFGATYYWQVTAYDSYGASSATAIAQILALLQNDPPAPFDAISGVGAPVTRATSVELSWQSASDADGDLVTYELSWRPVTESSPTVIVTTATTQPMAGLSFGTSYYWSVVARDAYGGERPLAGGTPQIYSPVFMNTAPPAPSVGAGAGVASIHTLSPQLDLSWSSVQDADGDTVTYRVALGTTPASLATVQDGAATSYALTPTFGTTYYWQVTASDPFGAASAAPVTSLLSLLSNTPPEPFAVLTGSGTVETRDSSVPLSWSQSSDADDDLVTYELALSTSAQSLSVVQVSTAVSYTLGFQYGTTYYWRVTARDGFGGAVASDLQAFRADFLDPAPAEPKLSAPFMSAPTVKTMHDGVEITWDKVANAQGDAITYTAYLGDQPAALRAVANVDQSSGTGVSALRAASDLLRPTATVADQGDKVSLLLSGLDYYHSYYFQVTAQTAYGAASRTPLQTFSLAPADSFPRAYNYPNPFSPSRGGTNVVFNAPASGYARAVLTIYSEFGQKLYERDFGPVPPGISQAGYDGRDRYGRALMNGSYVGRVRFDGPSETATFFLLVVK